MALFFAPPYSHFSHTPLQAQPPHIYLTWQGDTSTIIPVNYHTRLAGPLC